MEVWKALAVDLEWKQSTRLCSASIRLLASSSRLDTVQGVALPNKLTVNATLLWPRIQEKRETVDANDASAGSRFPFRTCLRFIASNDGTPAMGVDGPCSRGNSCFSTISRLASARFGSIPREFRD